MTQTAGRAARNAESKVIMYAATITESMQKTIDETNRRRSKQIAYNEAHGIVPKTIVKAIDSSLSEATGRRSITYSQQEESIVTSAAEQVEYKTKKQVEKAILEAKKSMEKAVKEMDFIAAAAYRDEMLRLKAMEEGMTK